MLSLSLILLSLILFLLLGYKTKSKPAKPKTPPGPRSLPIIGNLHQLGPLPHRSLHRLSKLHGPLLHLKLGRVPTLTISSPSLAQQSLKSLDLVFSGRAPLVPVQHYSFNFSDVALAPYGDTWRTLRKVFVSELLGPKKLALFRSVREAETAAMVRAISDVNSSAAVNVSDWARRLASRIICRVAFGARAGGDDVMFSQVDEILETASKVTSGIFWADIFPGFGWIDWVRGKMRRLRAAIATLDDFCEEVIGEHLRRGGGGDNDDGDIVDTLIGLWRGGQLNLLNVKGAIMDILFGGIETSAMTITWAMTELMKNPTVMEKAQNELREAIGKKGKVEESNLPQLEHLKFIVNETLRLHPTHPLLLPKETTQRCELNGFDIAPKTRVFVNVWAIGRDSEAWENPEEFNPNRFIGSSIDSKGQHFQLIPFGAGRRICPGINFGMATVELALGNLLYAFNWELPNGMKKEDIDMCEAHGIAAQKKVPLCLVPTKYELCIG